MAKTSTDAAAGLEKVSFEKALAELEDIVQKLEGGKVDLEESIALYERGAALKAHCEAKLKSAQERIEKIVVAADGKPKAEPARFD
ncbi:MAG TPA: exodeoxyribonuclease VII small subunit [Parvularculaceae bacterium]|nr:exodeoxyribonuclease VII small subunit [Parvularculaceae bacterium]